MWLHVHESLKTHSALLPFLIVKGDIMPGRELKAGPLPLNPFFDGATGEAPHLHFTFLLACEVTSPSALVAQTIALFLELRHP